MKDWFAHWFDTEYYHALYRHRDEQEAFYFLEKLVNWLQLPRGKALDVCCGRGRHSLSLHQLGFEVLGIDLSQNNITHAESLSKKGLHFLCGDMRYHLPAETFDLSVNLFTSFGYFDRVSDDLLALESMLESLNENGLLLIDFLNRDYILKTLDNKSIQHTRAGNWEFTWQRELQGDRICKKISVIDGETVLHYTELVRLYSYSDFIEMARTCKAQIVHIFGNYDLEPFEAQHSERLILCMRRSMP